MKHWSGSPCPRPRAVASSASPASPAPALAAKGGGNKKQAKTKVFEACKHGCQYRTIQKAVERRRLLQGQEEEREGEGDRRGAAGQVRRGRRASTGPEEEELRRADDRGDQEEPQARSILEGKNAKGELGAAQNGIEAISVDGLVLKNMWARNYQSNGFFIHAANEGGQHCDGYTMDNLLASANRSYGLFAKDCFGGKMINSAGYHHGDSAFYVGETPCDTKNWTNHGIAPPPTPCQKQAEVDAAEERQELRKRARLLGDQLQVREDRRIGLLQQRRRDRPEHARQRGLRAERLERVRTQRRVLEQLQLLPRRRRPSTPSPAGSAKLGGATVNYPTGVGIVLYGGDDNVVRDNNVFGNYKWGIASFSGPGEIFVANEGDDAKNINNQIVENMMGREGADPNGEYDIWNDATGGGNCWGGNSPDSTFAPGNGKVPLSQIYPACPQPEVAHTTRSSSLNIARRPADATSANESDPTTILGYAGLEPAAEPAVHLGPPGRRAPGVREIQAGRGRRRSPAN